MKRFATLGRSLSNDQLKMIIGGNTAESLPGEGHKCNCSCPNGAVVVCNDCQSSACFDSVYEACGGKPAASCSAA